ncbi:MAG: GtrA family protein [Candidatus Eisenbacteria bacterium]|nr:GtrA family protein [Candidatus Eisenbacteria bacterium]
MPLLSERRAARPPRSESTRLFRFALVGLSGAVVDFGLLNLLHAGFHLPLAPSNVLAVSAAILNNFHWNRRWTFADSDPTRAGRQLMRFVLVSLGGLAINTVVLLAAHRAFLQIDPDWLRTNLAKAVAVIVALGWNFTLNHAWTFRASGESR